MTGREEIIAPALPARGRDSHKGRCGHVLVVGGAVGMSGAPRLAGASALVSGAGLVTLAVPLVVRSEVAASDPALMVEGVPATVSGGLAVPALSVLARMAAARDAVVMGPGVGTHPATQMVLRRFLSGIDRPHVVDADALRSVPGLPCRRDRVLTPHPGEAARLLGSTVEEIQADRVAAIGALHAEFGGVVVLKGAGTLVTDGARLLENETGNPGLAVGGSGDVLAGIIGSLLGQGHDPLDAACHGVWIHGRAADDLLHATGERGMSPAALVSMLPRVIASLRG